jgi:hypothetical protein
MKVNSLAVAAFQNKLALAIDEFFEKEKKNKLIMHCQPKTDN